MSLNKSLRDNFEIKIRVCVSAITEGKRLTEEVWYCTNDLIGQMGNFDFFSYSVIVILVAGANKKRQWRVNVSTTMLSRYPYSCQPDAQSVVYPMLQ